MSRLFAVLTLFALDLPDQADNYNRGDDAKHHRHDQKNGDVKGHTLLVAKAASVRYRYFGC